MERLTTKFPNGYLFNLPSVNDENAQEKFANELAEKLGRYEDAEEQGYLMKLPVTIGDIVYRKDEEGSVVPMGVISIEIKGLTSTFKELKCKDLGFGGNFTFRFSDIGTKVFLSKEAAEGQI